MHTNVIDYNSSHGILRLRSLKLYPRHSGREAFQSCIYISLTIADFKLLHIWDKNALLNKWHMTIFSWFPALFTHRYFSFFMYCDLTLPLLSLQSFLTEFSFIYLGLCLFRVCSQLLMQYSLYHFIWILSPIRHNVKKRRYYIISCTFFPDFF